MELPLSDEERAIYEWQMWVPGFGEAGQKKLRKSAVLISRTGGLGGLVAYQLAAAGIGRLVLAHAGNVRPSDLNRQLLMTHASLGTSRIESARRRLLELNPRLEIEAIPENISSENVDRLVSSVDLVVDCAPLFEERFAMNEAAVHHRKPLVECAMYNLEFQVFSVKPYHSACLRCLYRETPSHWRRQFPVFGAVSGTAACLGAVEAIKILSGIGQPLYNQMLTADLETMEFRKFHLERDPSCTTCGALDR